MKRCLRLFKSFEASLDINPPKGNYRFKTILGKRHRLRHPQYNDMKSFANRTIEYTKPLNDFQTAQDSLGQMQIGAERALLAEYAKRLTSEESKELYASWRRRKMDEQEILDSQPKAEDAPPRTFPDEWSLVDSIYMEESELTNVSVEYVGRYIKISKERADVLFRNGYFGDFLQDEYAYNNEFNIMVREETVKLIRLLKLYQNVDGIKYLIDQPKDVLDPELPEDLAKTYIEAEEARTKVENQLLQETIDKLKALSPEEQIGWLVKNNANTYVLLYKNLCKALNEVLDELQDLSLHNLFTNSSQMFDGSINMLIQELRHTAFYNVVFDGLTKPIFELDIHELDEFLANSSGLKTALRGLCKFYKSKISHEDTLRQLEFVGIARYLTPFVDLDLGSCVHRIDLKNYGAIEKLFKLPKEFWQMGLKGFRSFNSNILLTGPRGAGKSQILTGLAIWAHNEGNWVVVRVPRVTDFTRNASTNLWDPSGPYLQPDVALDILQELKLSCGDKLAKVQIKPELYGKYNIAALHDVYDSDYKPLPTIHHWDEETKVHTDDWKRYFTEEVLETMYEGQKEFPIAPRKPRLDREIELLDSQLDSPEFAQMMKEYDSDDEASKLGNYEEDDPLIQRFEDRIFYLPKTSTKKKPKKFRIPKCSANTLKYTHRHFKRVSSHEMSTDTIPLADRMIGVPSATRLGEKLPAPTGLLEIIDFGLANPIYGTNALAEALEQLYHTDNVNLLVLVDEANELFRPSHFRSIKYMNIKQAKGFIPPYDIALCRLFMRFDGHRIKNGLKIYASSEKYLKGHTLSAEKVNLPRYVNFPVEPMCLNEFRSMVQYYTITDWLDSYLAEYQVENAYMISQGNWYAAQQYLAPFIDRYY